MRSVSSEDFNKAGWVRYRFFFLKEEGTLMGETISSERERNNSRHRLSHKAVDIQPQAPGLTEEGNKGKEFKHQVSTN